MLFRNPVRTSKRTPHFTITKINWLTLFKFNKAENVICAFILSTTSSGEVIINPLESKLVLMISKRSVRASKKTHTITIIAFS